MNIDTRINNDFFLHPKTVRLQSALGEVAPMYLIKLWLYASKFFSNGIITGLDDKMLEEQIGWSGKHEGNFIETLENIGFVERVDGKLVLHDWNEHNQWASNDNNRKDLNRFNSLGRYFPNVYKLLQANGICKITAEQFKAIKDADNPEQKAAEIFKVSSQGENKQSQMQSDVQNQSNSHMQFASKQKCPISISKPYPNTISNSLSNTGRENDCSDEPSMEFVELRDFYDHNARPEGSEAGWIEFKKVKHESGKMGTKSFPGVNLLMDDILERIDKGFWDKNFIPSLGKYLRERTWEQPVKTRVRPERMTFAEMEEEREAAVRERRLQRAREYDQKKQSEKEGSK